MLHLVIEQSKVLVYSNTVKTIENMNDASRAYATSAPSATAATGFTYLLTGELQDFQRFARTENAKWLIDIAHDICDPRRRRGTLWVWIDGQDGLVQATDPLLPKVYEYRVTEPIPLTKISRREGKSKSISAPESSASRMGTDVQERDNSRCWITSYSWPIVNSHICPKRLGNEQIQFIYRDFTNLEPPPGLNIFDARLGLCLFKALDTSFDIFEFGFRSTYSDQYEVHDFGSRNLNIIGAAELSVALLPSLHGTRISPPNPSSTHNPPPGLFAWHYLQCVIRKFGAPDYCGVPNIEHYARPMRMEGDSDDDGTDDEADWPSAVFDRGRWVREREAEESERMNTTAAWVHTQ